MRLDEIGFTVSYSMHAALRHDSFNTRACGLIGQTIKRLNPKYPSPIFHPIFNSTSLQNTAAPANPPNIIPPNNGAINGNPNPPPYPIPIGLPYPSIGRSHLPPANFPHP